MPQRILNTVHPPQSTANQPIRRLNNSKLSYAQTQAVSILTQGGDHEYLGLVLYDAEYVRIAPTPTAFVAPSFPTVITIDALTTAVVAVQACKNHTQKICVYRECKNVQIALIWHIHNAVEEKYTKHLVDKDTGPTEDDIITVLQYMFKNYGKV